MCRKRTLTMAGAVLSIGDATDQQSSFTECYQKLVNVILKASGIHGIHEVKKNTKLQNFPTYEIICLISKLMEN